MRRFPIVLKGGQLLDGTGADRFSSDLAIEGDRIAAIGEGLAGLHEVDCSGLFLAPGFLDTHTHSDLMLLADPEMALKTRQGVTLDIVGQDGVSLAPIHPEQRESHKHQLTAWAGFPDVAWSWTNVSGYLDALDRAKPAIDAAYLVPHGNVRSQVMGQDNRLATASERRAMQDMVRTAFEEGAIGLSTGLIYQPCSYADTDELKALCEVAGAYGRPLVIHLRSESNRLLEALDEVFQIGAATGAPLHLSHFKIAGPPHWGFLPHVLERVERAREKGVRVTADQYPYVAGSTTLGTVLPPWCLSGGADAAVERLHDPEIRTRIRREWADDGPCDWENIYRWIGPEGIVIADIASGRHPEWIGKSLREAASLADPCTFTMDLLQDERMGVTMVCFSQSEQVVQALMSQPWINVCSDGLVGGKPHPRAYGSFARVLGRYVRDLGLISWEEAVRKMTLQAAQSFGLDGHGQLVEGALASMVAFDPATVQDTATFEEPRQFPHGIPHLWVRGVPVVEDHLGTGHRPGRAIRLLS